MSSKRDCLLRLRVERLEDRLVLAPQGALPWPIAAPGDLYTLYGQWVEAGGIHFHEGVDILASAGTDVRAIEDGNVVAFSNNGVNPSQSYVVMNTGDHGWNFFHVIPAKVFDDNEFVTAGTLLSTIAAQPGGVHPDHLHLDYGSNASDPLFAPLRRPIDDPLHHLALLDSAAPTVDPDFHFRTAESEGPGPFTGGGPYPYLMRETPATNHFYFYTFDGVRNDLVVGGLAPTHDANQPTPITQIGSPNIDIIGDVYDQFMAGGRLLAPKSVSLQVRGEAFGDDTGVVTPVNFDGEFTYSFDDPVGHNYPSLRNYKLARSTYEHDVQSQSIDQTAYWYTLTNYSGDSIVQEYDRPSSWRTNVVRYANWYDPGASTAPNNARSAFRDDYYIVTITATDNSGNVTRQQKEIWFFR